MKKSVHNFFANLIDYAGLFPPAELEMQEAWQEFCALRDTEYRWMLPNFICPASRLEELIKYFRKTSSDSGIFPFSILGSGGKDGSTFLSNMQKDVRLIADFLSFNRKDSVVVNIFETAFPPQAIINGGQLEVHDIFRVTNDSISPVLNEPGMIFYELSVLEPEWDIIQSFIEAISAYNDSARIESFTEAQHLVGFKMRCGGVTAGAFPTVDTLSGVVSLCRKHKVPLKATAGLHHPIRHFDSALKTKMHGFINLIGAVILAYCHRLNIDQIRKIISDEDAESFSFSDDFFRWQDCEANEAQITSARRQAFLSFGSCCIDEPIDDLKALGIF